ncbi:hypothetical protein CANARDRAFT_10439 [[Candida] arabinofermentans NRRL YB-2248]|uniref:Pre-mRNA-splicing factor SLT11 n=1 Tax=[Candida] arabinofermentans NRRL YB-2248 TaxID=983967 RepID=A0A1E4SST4_9ASCO|nr:hypothetical protein CANARDRAFT_10439 [[Candida] arabinofermentans NRRL YB-2248]
MDSNYNEQSTPAVCASCLGPNPYVEMLRERNGLECKLCTRPFTVFKWAPVKGRVGSGSFKKTVICLTCARSKNCCQSCMLDLNFGIDLTTRDQLLKLASGNGGKIEKTLTQDPQNQVMKIYKADQLERKYAEQGEAGVADLSEKMDRAKELLDGITKLSESTSSNKITNKKSSGKQSTVTNGKKMSSAELLKLCKDLPFNGRLSVPPTNKKVKSFFIFGINDRIADYLIKEKINELLSEPRNSSKKVESLSVNHKGMFGFIELSDRATAERLASIISSKQSPEISRGNASYPFPCLLVIDSCPMRVCWAGKHLYNGGDSGFEMANIRQIVIRQMVKYAEKDNEISIKRESKDDHSILSASNKKRKLQALPPPPGKSIKYKTTKSDYEL